MSCKNSCHCCENISCANDFSCSVMNEYVMELEMSCFKEIKSKADVWL